MVPRSCFQFGSKKKREFHSKALFFYFRKLFTLKIGLTSHKTHSSFIFTKGVHIWNNNCLWYVDTTKVLDPCYGLGVKGESQIRLWCVDYNKSYIYLLRPWDQRPGQIYFESVLRLVTQAPLVFYDWGASYFVQWLPIWRLSQRSLLSNSGPKLKVRNEHLIFVFLNQNICCGYSKEPSQGDGSFAHPNIC